MRKLRKLNESSCPGLSEDKIKTQYALHEVVVYLLTGKDARTGPCFQVVRDAHVIYLGLEYFKKSETFFFRTILLRAFLEVRGETT